jgi:hypothetical protein
MQSVRQRRTLVVANRTAATPLLLDEIQRRAVEHPTTFVLLRPTVRSRSGPDWTLDDALKALRRAASGPTRHLPISVEGLDGGPDAFQAVKQALADGGFDDVIISTLPKRTRMAPPRPTAAHRSAQRAGDRHHAAERQATPRQRGHALERPPQPTAKRDRIKRPPSNERRDQPRAGSALRLGWLRPRRRQEDCFATRCARP